MVLDYTQYESKIEGEKSITSDPYYKTLFDKTRVLRKLIIVLNLLTNDIFSMFTL